MTGTKPHAESGQLLFLVGGSAKPLEIARPVLSALGRDVVHLGPVGSGALMKLINNFLAAVHTVSFGEALALIQSSGLDPKKAVPVLTEGVPGSPMVKRVAARVESGDFTPHFFMRLMAKDVSYALQEARERNVDLKTASAAFDVLAQARRQCVERQLHVGPERVVAILRDLLGVQHGDDRWRGEKRLVRMPAIRAVPRTRIEDGHLLESVAQGGEERMHFGFVFSTTKKSRRWHFGRG